MANESISHRRSIMKPLVFEIAFAISLCIWIVTLMAWALS
jgi:hypothetical protein